MILYLRDQNNDTILDVECYVTSEEGSSKYVELHSTVCVAPYSKFLLANPDKQDEIIRLFDELSELRGWLWESYFKGGVNDPEKYDEIIKLLRGLLKGVARDYNLSYVED